MRSLRAAAVVMTAAGSAFGGVFDANSTRVQLACTVTAAEGDLYSAQRDAAEDATPDGNQDWVDASVQAEASISELIGGFAHAYGQLSFDDDALYLNFASTIFARAPGGVATAAVLAEIEVGLSLDSEAILSFCEWSGQGEIIRHCACAESVPGGAIRLEVIDSDGAVVLGQENHPAMRHWPWGCVEQRLDAGDYRVVLRANLLALPDPDERGDYQTVDLDGLTVAVTPGPLPRCRGDANGDGVVDFADVTAVLRLMGARYWADGGAGDANLDSLVNVADVAAVLEAFGSACE